VAHDSAAGQTSRELAEFLATTEALHDLTPEERVAIASLCRERLVAAGGRVLEQGRANASLLFLRRGQLTIRAHRSDGVETLARLSPPSVVGEISFLTGRTCSADADVTVDATIVELSRDALSTVPETYARIVQGLSRVVAARFHDAVVVGSRSAQGPPVVLVQPGRSWELPQAFATELSRTLGANGVGEALLVRAGEPGNPLDVARTGAGPWVTNLGPNAGPEALRKKLVDGLPSWTSRFSSLVLSPGSRADADDLETMRTFATHVLDLAGPGDPVSDRLDGSHFVVQDARRPTLSRLTVRSRLLWDVSEAARAYSTGARLPDRFTRGVASVARAILGSSLGLVLGAGGARGWAHIGVLEVLTRAGLSFDAVTGSSMGSIVGGLVASGVAPSALRGVMAEWPRRDRRERRFWRMHIGSEAAFRELLGGFFGDRTLTTLELPFVANAVDIERAEEIVISSGLLRDAARASMAFPGWLPPFVMNGRVLVDGATLNPVPSVACRALGAHFVLAVNALGPFVPSPLARRWPMREFDVLARTFHMSGYAMGQARSEAASDIVITPDLGDATMLSFDRYEELVDAGVRAGEAVLPAVRTAYARHQATASPGRSTTRARA
jgi:NTE family protein